jgi:signal transduction histidine kinase
MCKNPNKNRSQLFLLLLGLTVFLCTNPYCLAAQTTYSKLKAAFILRFADNITWQNEAEIKTFRIGILSDGNETYDVLSYASSGKNIRNKPIEIIQLRKISEIKDIQMLYVSSLHVSDIIQIYTTIEKKNILLVTEACPEPQFIMLNLLYNSVSQSVSFQINKANLIIENFEISPNLLLLGGTEVDIREIYRQMQLHLAEESKNVNKQKELLHIQAIQLDSQTTMINSQNNVTISLLKNIEDLKNDIDSKESDLSKLNAKINIQETILKDKSEQILKREIEFQKQNAQISQSEKMIDLKSKELDQLFTEIGKQKKEIEEQKSILSSKENFIKTQKKFIYSVIGFSIALCLLGISIFFAYKTKKRANATLEDRVAQRTKELEEEIRERKHVELELIQATRKAEDSDRLKTAFLQNMSHEIRTPMNAIMGFSELLVENAKDKSKIRYFTDIIRQRSNDLLDIINDILYIAKIESGQLPLSLEESNLHPLFEELDIFFLEYQKRLEKQDINLSIQFLKASPEIVIMTDKVKLKQIFINLISNALKFTEKGSIEAGYKLVENNKILFYVSDTGIGIPSDKQIAVFERFTQLKQTSKMNIGGTGLGLSIVKGLVNLLGSEIVLESAEGKGSIFSFTLPYDPQQHLTQKQIVPELPKVNNLSNQTILIVEDDQFNAEYIKEILSDKGLKIIHAENGSEAIKLASSESVDLVLMDIRLPDIDGYDATRKILSIKPMLKIIAQTAYVSQEEQQYSKDAGCIDYISKPIRANSLINIVNKHLSKD